MTVVLVAPEDDVFGGGAYARPHRNEKDMGTRLVLCYLLIYETPVHRIRWLSVCCG